MESCFEKIPTHLRKFVDPALPREMRFMVAKGLIPAGPKDLAVILYSLTSDRDEEIRKEAEASLESMPEGVMAAVLSDNSAPPQFLDYIARKTTLESRLEKIVLNYSTDDETIAYLAETAHFQSVLEIIAGNQERILRSEMVLEALGNNPALSRSSLERVTSFIRLYLDKKGETSGSMGQDARGDDDVDRHDDFKESAEPEEDENRNARKSFLDYIDFDQELTQETGEETGEERRESLFSLIKKMSVPERIKLAIVGNREARMILIHDPRRIVAATVLASPRLSDTEVILFCQSKTVDEEILRAIASTRKWTRAYQVKLALVNNPKTPPDLSLHFMPHLRDRELKSLSNNRNIPGVVTAAAKRMARERMEKGAR